MPDYKKDLLQQIADDERRPANEREAARRELAAPVAQSPPSPRRRGRNANAPMSQEDEDSDLIQALTFRPNDGLTILDRREIEADFDPITRECLDTIGNACLLWIWNPSDTQRMIELHARTKSPFIKSKTIAVLQHIAAYSTIQAARDQASEFLHQLDSNPGELN
jgi:hypothetical protein